MSIASSQPPVVRQPGGATTRHTAPLAHARLHSHLRPVPDAPERLGEVGALPAVLSENLLVPTLTGAVDYANFDHAASTPALVSV